MTRRAAIYARVSTEHEAQISALENQVQYYDELLSRHPELTLVERYIDEGITGTSIHKREGFLRMMQDAKDGKFDLIITREVSRFARNTVDTLQQTRILKSYGVEVWFTEDNIWTLNDEDGELRLSIMATLAQNESKKISQRVKAGQMISFKNGVIYGTGNILGYDRVDKNHFVVNKEQAETVKRIYELYLDGNGVRRIQDIMEQEGRKTATGLTRWSSSNISRILKNSFYCGRIEYRKEYVPDYLTQKKIRNDGAVEKVYVEGNHEPIITPEMYDEAQRMRSLNSFEKKDAKGNVKMNGQSPCKNVWGRKCKCKCGHALNRRMAHMSKTGEPSFVFQCYDQLHTGTPRFRKKKGLDIEGICDNDTFMEWKLVVQADFLFKKLVSNRQAIYDDAISMAADLLDVKSNGTNVKEKVENNIKQIDKLKSQISVLVDMCTLGEISREMYQRKKEKIEKQISNLEKSNEECQQEVLESENDILKQERIKSLTAFINMEAFDPRAKIPDRIIDGFVERIIYDKGEFIWYLNPQFGNAIFEVDTTEWKKKMFKANKMVYPSLSGTGCNQAGSVMRIIEI